MLPRVASVIVIVVVASVVIATAGAVVVPALDSSQSPLFGSGPAASAESVASLRATSDPVTESQAAPIEVDSCRVIDESGTYILTQDIDVPAGTGRCLLVFGSSNPADPFIEVVVDGNGYQIVPAEPAGADAGVVVSGSRMTTVIQNLEVTGWINGIEVRDVEFQGSITLSNVVATGNRNGVFVDDGDRLVIEDSEFSNNERSGIDFTEVRRPAEITNVVANGNDGDGFDCRSCDSVTLTDSEFSNNGENGIDLSAVETPIVLSGVVANENGANGLDHFDYGDIEVTDSEFSNNAGDGLHLDGLGISAELTRVVAANNGRDGVLFTDGSQPRRSLVISDSEFVENARNGVAAGAEVSVQLTDSVIARNTVGIDLSERIWGVALATNRIEENRDAGLSIATVQRQSSVRNNVFENTVNVHFDAGSPGPVDWDNADPTPGLNVVDGAFLGGNYYASPSGDGFSQTCTDADVDTLCDDPLALVPGQVDEYPLAEPAASAAEPPTQFAPADLRGVTFAVDCGVLTAGQSVEFGYGPLGDVGIPPDAASQEWTNEEVLDVVFESPLGPAVKLLGVEPDDLLWAANPDEQVVRVFADTPFGVRSCTCTVVD